MTAYILDINSLVPSPAFLRLSYQMTRAMQNAAATCSSLVWLWLNWIWSLTLMRAI